MLPRPAAACILVSVANLIAEVVPVGPRIFGFDCLSKLTADLCRVFQGFGCAFAMRYVDLAVGVTPLTLDVDEVDAICRPDFSLRVCQFARSSGWSLATGRNDGVACVRNMMALSLPLEAGAVCDLEGSFASKGQCIDYAGAWWEAATSEGLDRDATDVYVGAGVPLSGEELEDDLAFRGYMQSGSEVPDVARRGYRVRQVRPLDQTVAGIRVDWNVLQTDYKGSRPRWIRTVAGAVALGMAAT